MMKATQKVHDMGQSIWLDNITRTLLTSGTLQRYIQEFAVTGLTSNPTIFDHAIRNSTDYDDAIRQKVQEGKSRETVFFELALEDLRQAADLFRPIHDQSNGVDGWVSPVSPELAHYAARTIDAAKKLHEQASTGTKDPQAADTLYVSALASPSTINTMPEATLNAFADHGKLGESLPIHERGCDQMLTEFSRAGIDIDVLAARLQEEGAAAFVKSWSGLMHCIASRSQELKSVQMS